MSSAERWSGSNRSREGDLLFLRLRRRRNAPPQRDAARPTDAIHQASEISLLRRRSVRANEAVPRHVVSHRRTETRLDAADEGPVRLVGAKEEPENNCPIGGETFFSTSIITIEPEVGCSLL